MYSGGDTAVVEQVIGDLVMYCKCELSVPGLCFLGPAFVNDLIFFLVCNDMGYIQPGSYCGLDVILWTVWPF